MDLFSSHVTINVILCLLDTQFYRNNTKTEKEVLLALYNILEYVLGF